MTDISKLLFQREYFPVEVVKAGKSYSYSVTVPPYHPSMAREGINFELAVSALDESLENTVKDLEEMTQKGVDVRSELESISRDPTTRKIQRGQIRIRDFGVVIDPFPITDCLYISRDVINPLGPGGDNYIAIRPGRGPFSFAIPVSVVLPEKLMLEYEMKERGVALEHRNIECPHLWASHNLSTIDRILYKNLVIAIDNAVVTRKYK